MSNFLSSVSSQDLVDLDSRESQHYSSQGEINNSIMKDLDGYQTQINSLDSRENSHFNYIGTALDSVKKDLDGYVTAAQGSDGYVAFFTGAKAIAGDNDLYYNRETGALTFNGDGYVQGRLTVTGQTVYSPLMNVPDGTTHTIDWSQASFHTIDLVAASGNVTVAFTGAVAGAFCTIKIIQDPASALNITWPAAVKWAEGYTPTISTTLGAIDIVSLIFDGDNYYATIAQAFA